MHQLITAIQFVVRAAVTAGLSVALAWLCRLEYPIYAGIAASDLHGSFDIEDRQARTARLVAVGGPSAAPLRQVLQPSEWVIAFGFLVAMLIRHISRIDYGAKVSSYICGIFMVAHGAHPWSYAFLRFTEGVLGIGCLADQLCAQVDSLR